MQDDGKIECRCCGKRVHIIQAHLREDHPEITIESYQEQYPDAPIMSERAKRALAERRKTTQQPAPGVVDAYTNGFKISKAFMHEVFGLGAVKAALGHTGKPIPITMVEAPEDVAPYIPDVDENYVWNIDLLKTVLMAFEINKPVYLWGHAGVGKTTVLEQICAHTKRPWLRVQHTRNTEEAHVIGQYVVKDGATVFELGPLAYAMKYGLTYVADEYDFAMPAITALYQPVLEGKPLVIKEAPIEDRVIRPHPLFRFAATGNTNGTGDETGLYQGTTIQNAANYERFAIVEEVRYPERQIEVNMVSGQGGIPVKEAEKMVGFGVLIREAFTNGKIGLPVSPRALINAAQLGKLRGSLEVGLQLSYINRLSRVDQEVARETLRRISL